MAYESPLNPNSIDSHQTNPGAVITILQWEDREPVIPGVNNNSSTGKGLGTREKPYAIHSDILNIAFINTKAQLTPTFTATLTMGDINYVTAIHPGDFAFLNMVNFQTKSVEIASRAVNLEHINGAEDGFCGVFKIQTVRQVLSTDANGTKTYLCQIAASGFTEFNNILCFNPSIAAAFAQKGQDLSQFYVGDYFSERLKSVTSIHETIQDIMVVLIGESRKHDAKTENYGNKHFKLPANVGKLLGRSGIQYASEMYNYVTGVWANNNASDGFFPGFSSGSARGGNSVVSNFFQTTTPIQGDALIGLDDWNNVTAWSIIQQYINSAVNEIYTCYRVSPDDETKVMPTVVIRQKPFTSPDFEEQGMPITRFLDLPRWVLNPDLVFSSVLGFEEAARINFVQCYTRRIAANAKDDHAAQIELGNFFYDTADIQRNGLKPYVISSNFDFQNKGKDQFRAAPWARLNADWVIGAHLKAAGTIDCAGIEDPVCVGDNLAYDGTVYHIETVAKNMQIGMDGKLRFTTSFKVSYGVDETIGGDSNSYPEMEDLDSQINRVNDFNFSKLLPGYSDTQDIAKRNVESGGEKIKSNNNNGFSIGTKKTLKSGK